MTRAPHLRCRCGAEEVPNSDIAAHVGGMLVVHGLYHCFTMAACPLARRRRA